MKLTNLIYGVSTLILFSACGNKQNAGAPTSLQKYPVTEIFAQDVELSTTYPASLKGQQDIEIRPRIDGFIQAIYVDEGDVVKKGKVLFKINSPQAEQALTSAKAAIEMAKASVNTAKTNVDRITPLAQKGIVGEVQLTTAQDAYNTAIASLNQAEAAYKNAKATQGWTDVTSPVDGLVGSIPFRLGSLVNSMNVLTTIADIENIYAYFSLNEKEFTAMLNKLEGTSQNEKIKNIPELTLTLADGSVYPHKGRVETITGSVNATTGSVTFRAEFPNKEHLLRSGMSGRVTLPNYINEALLVPQKAVFEQQNKNLVYQVQGDSVILKAITVLPTPDGQNYVVTSGLNAKDVVVTDGIITLRHGKKITVE